MRNGYKNYSASDLFSLFVGILICLAILYFIVTISSRYFI